MNDEERYKIVSEEYADLLVEYNDDMNSFNRFLNYSVNFIDRKYAVVHIPVGYMTPNSVYKYGYGAIPRCYGLESSPSLASSGITRILNVPDYRLKGQGVLIGVVDTGIDYRNPVFQNADGSTRIVSIWDQTIHSEANYPYDLYYGTEYSKEQINQALISDDPLDYVPSMDENGHGTMLAGIAAGSNIIEQGFMGVASDSELVIVKLKTAKQYLKDFFSIPNEAICYQENDMMLGVKYLLQVANQLHRPIAICLGTGTTQGDHSGRGIYSDYLSSVADTEGTAIVVSAGNEGQRGHHYYGELAPSIGYDNIELNIASGEHGFSMELWGISPNQFAIDIYAPTGEFISRIPPTIGQSRTIQLNFQNTVILIDNQTKESITGDQLILLRFKNPMAGVWRLGISGKSDLIMKFHVWLPMVGFITKGTFFLKPNPYTIITSPANAISPITITAYNHIDQSLYSNASKGYTRLNTVKPDLAAPGVNIYCPTIGNEFVRSTGSGLAGAHATGVAAMLLEWGIIRGNFTTLNSTQIKRMLIQGAKRDPILSYPNQEWGYGILDIYGTCDIIRNSLI